ncbi:MAG: Gfo/Idh/MocA family oxidoreductase [SAR324 cluster bacterium]|nr:Gfo/Idh/MocA family oxidoreductase [SAR324 cluster bacterium]
MAEGKVVNLALIGAGAWSGCIGHVMNKSSRVNLVTCFDEIPEKREACSKKFACEAEESFEAVLKRDDIDGIHLATPNFLHPEQTILAAEHGKHIFVEKPIANTIADGEKMIEVCQKAGVTLMVGQHMRRLTGIRKLKELIDGGSIGKPIQVEGNYSQNIGFSLTPASFRWRGDDTGCPAGSLMTMGIHHADVFNYLFGSIKSAFSYFNKLYIEAPVEDVTALLFQYESGVLGYLGSNYASPKAVWFYIYGTEANLLCTITPPELPFEEYLKWWERVDEDTTVQIFKKGQTGAEAVPIAVGNPILEEIEEFADCIVSGRTPETDGISALNALRLIRGAIDSARTGEQTLLSRLT